MTKHANTKFDAATRTWVFDPTRARERFELAVVTDGVVRWTTNNSIPFDDMLGDFEALGLIDAATRSRSTAQRAADNAAFARARSRRPRRVSAEERFEMRAAFGPGVEVVNVLTGDRCRT